MNIALTGFSGALSNALQSLILESENHNIAFGISKSIKQSSSYNHSNQNEYSIFENFDELKDLDIKCDGIIDFSHRDNILDILKFAKERSIPVVIGTTGLLDEDVEKIKDASKSIPILLSHNTSYGVNVLMQALEKLSSDLKEYDIEIIEKHHNRKIDAPSGTSFMLLDSMKKTRNDLVPVYSRQKNNTKRQKNEVGIHSIRGGNIISEHEVIFAGKNDILTIGHSSINDKVFAEGAILGLEYLSQKNKGLYQMEDVIDNR